MDKTEMVKRLMALQRYQVGSGDDGDGYLYDYEDASKTGRWVKWGDIEALIKEIIQ